MRAVDVMTSPVVTVTRDTPFRRMVALLQDHRISALPVIDAAGHLIGVVSESDLLSKEDYGTPHGMGLNPRADATVAGELMTSPPITVDTNASLREVARLLSLNEIKRVPVMDGGRLVGIVTRSDVLKVFLRPDRDMQHEALAHAMTARRFGEIEAVQVTVRDGVAVVRGNAESRPAAERIAARVGSVDGVVKVLNEISFPDDG
jgi:CBS domain-containing protein